MSERRGDPSPTEANDVNLPEGWVLATIQGVCEVNPGKPHKDALAAEAPVTFVPMSAVDAACGSITAPEQRSYTKVRTGFTSFRENDVLMAKITPCMENGKAAVARGLVNGLGFGSTEFHVLRSLGAVLPELVYHFIRQESFRGEAKLCMSGNVGQQRVTVEFMREAAIPLPPLAEQKRIVAKVEALLARQAAVRERLARVPLILKRFRQAVLTTLITGEGMALGDVLTDVKYGTAKKCQPEPIGTPVLRIPNVVGGTVDRSDLKYAVLDERERRTLHLETGDLLLIRSNGSVSLLGRTAVVTEKEDGYAYAGYLMRLRLDKTRADPRYVHFALEAHDCRVQIEMPARSSSGVHNINTGEVRELQIPLPSLEEQQQIICRVEKLLSLADAIEKHVATATTRADRLVQSILAKAFRGELVPTEAELARREGRSYEPASALLARIQAERWAGIPQGRKPGRKKTSVATRGKP